MHTSELPNFGGSLWDWSLWLGLHCSPWLKHACAVQMRSMVERRGATSRLAWSLLMSSMICLSWVELSIKVERKGRTWRPKTPTLFSWNASFVIGSSRNKSFTDYAYHPSVEMKFPVLVFSADWRQCLWLPDNVLWRGELLLCLDTKTCINSSWDCINHWFCLCFLSMKTVLMREQAVICGTLRSC